MPDVTTTYRDRPTVIASPDDPCGRATGLVWETIDLDWWRLQSADDDNLGDLSFIYHLAHCKGEWTAYRSTELVHRGTLADCARALVEAVGR